MNYNRPEWNERFICQAPTMDTLGIWGDRMVPYESESYKHFVAIEVWDKDFNKEDDLVGKGFIDYGKIHLEKGKSRIKWIELQHNDEITGRIQIKFGWAPPQISIAKTVLKDSEGVKEGFVRVRLLCQINLLKLDEIENCLFGADYRPEAKLNVKKLKEILMVKLGMHRSTELQLHARIFAFYLVDQCAEVLISPRDKQILDLDENKQVLACRIITTLMSHLSQNTKGLQYYAAEKEEKVKLIVGEKIQNDISKSRLIAHLKSSDAKTLSFSEFDECFEQSGIKLAKETIECAFIHLVKKSKGLVVDVDKDVFLRFILDSSTQAYNMTMTGNAFPIEKELLEYSSDSDDFGHDRDSSRRGSQVRSGRGSDLKYQDSKQLLHVPDKQSSFDFTSPPEEGKFEEEALRKSIEESEQIEVTHQSINAGLG